MRIRVITVAIVGLQRVRFLGARQASVRPTGRSVAADPQGCVEVGAAAAAFRRLAECELA
jgi:hypothetical protein